MQDHLERPLSFVDRDARQILDLYLFTQLFHFEKENLLLGHHQFPFLLPVVGAQFQNTASEENLFILSNKGFYLTLDLAQDFGADKVRYLIRF